MELYRISLYIGYHFIQTDILANGISEAVDKAVQKYKPFGDLVDIISAKRIEDEVDNDTLSTI